MKCNYCDREAKGINPYNNKYLCDVCADEKVKQLCEEYNDYDSDTKKDWFLKIIEEDQSKMNITISTITGEIV